MHRSVLVLGAPSSIGIRPDDQTGAPQSVDRAPEIFRHLGVVERLDATDLGDVVPPPYEDFVRPPGRARNEAGVGTYSRWLADRVATGLAGHQFLVVLGGDCSIVLGCLLGSSRLVGPVGLAYVDAHADFATPEESQTGSVASMGLALAVGRGDSPLARLAGRTPIVRAEHVALIGRRDASEPSYGHEGLRTSGILDLPHPAIQPDAVAATLSATLARIAESDLNGFWILVDADVIDPAVMPAVGSPEPGGPGIDELAALLGPMVNHPRALGLAITLYDPSLDADRSCAERLVGLLEQIHGRGVR
jgi:arginase